MDNSTRPVKIDFMLRWDWLNYLIGGGIPLLLIYILVRWTSKRQNSLSENKNQFLKAIVSQYSGNLKSNGVEFYFEGSLIQAFFVDPVMMGSGEYLQTVPGFFALKCESPTPNVLKFPLIIKNVHQLNDLPFQEPAIHILKNNFDEIEIDSHSIQARKINVVLSKEAKENLLKELKSIVPYLVQMQRVIS